MTLIDGLQSIATKLGISQENAALIHAYHRNCLNKLGMRKMQAMVNDVVERFNLDDFDYQHNYGEQLIARGVLTQAEAQLFSYGEYDDAERPPAQENTAIDPNAAA